MIKDMTKGSPFKVILSFSLPMFLSMAFQQIYSIVDSIIAGKYIGVNALAAVGASYPITMLFIAIASGASIGCSVVVSQIFGAKQLAKMKSAIWTAIFSLTILGILLTIIGILICNPLLHILGTEKDIFSDSALYLRIYILGILFLFLYNTATAIYTGLGDSKTPLYFLIFSSVLNIILDLVFVINFKMKIAGVAWATFLAQGIASILAISTLILKVKKIKVLEDYKKFDIQLLKRMSKIAVPSIMQQSFVSVGQLFVQKIINSYGQDVIAGYSAGFKINIFVIQAFNTFGSAVSSYSAQNLGAGNTDRIKKGWKIALKMVLGISIIGFIITFFFADTLIGLFVEENAGEKVVDVGAGFLRIVAPFFPIVSIKIACDGVLRGIGAMTEFMIATFSDLIFRVILSFAFSALFHTYLGIWWAWPVGWIIGSAFSLIFYLRQKELK